MSSRRNRVPKTEAPADYRRPVCKSCGNNDHVVKLHGRWVCSVHLKVRNTKYNAEGRLQIPLGVKDEDLPMHQREFFKLAEVLPNRRARRAMR